jgi:hypothetical protein
MCSVSRIRNVLDLDAGEKSTNLTKSQELLFWQDDAGVLAGQRYWPTAFAADLGQLPSL